jgi:uncharacterized protein (TIGR00369 family)
MTDDSAREVEYGVTPTEVMASMTGIDFLRAMFAGRLPAPPIMQNIEPFDYSVEPGVVSFSSTPGFRHYNPIGSVHGGYAATLLDSACGIAVHSQLGPGRGHTTLELKVSFLRALGEDSGTVRAVGRVTSLGRRVAFAEATLHDGTGQLCATATSTLLVFDVEHGSQLSPDQATAI